MAKTAAQRQREQRERTAAKLDMFERLDCYRRVELRGRLDKLTGPMKLTGPVAEALLTLPLCHSAPEKISLNGNAVMVTWPNDSSDPRSYSMMVVDAIIRKVDGALDVSHEAPPRKNIYRRNDVSPGALEKEIRDEIITWAALRLSERKTTKL